MKKSLVKNYIYSMSYQVLAILIPFVTTPYLSRILKPEGVGISSYTISIITYFCLIGSLGISLYGQREIAYVQDNKVKRTEKFIELFLLKVCSMTIAIIVYCLFIRNQEYNIYFKILIFELTAYLLDISWFFQGIENFKVTVMKNLVVKIVSLICIFTFVKTENDVGTYLLIYGGSTFLGNLTLWLNIRKELCKVSIKNIHVFQSFLPVVLFLIPQIANKLYAIIDKTMLGIMVNNISETGFYEQADKIVKIWITVITALGMVIMPRIANYFAKKDKEKIKELMNKTFQYVYFCSIPLMFGLIAIAKNIIPLYLGEGFDKSIMMIQLLAPIILLIGLNNIIGNQYLLPTGQTKKYTIAVICGTCLNFVLNIFLIKYFAGFGAVVSTIISEFSVLLIELFFTRSQFSIRQILKLSFNYLIAGVIMFVVLIPLANITNSLIINCIFQVVIGCIVYFGILWLIKDKFLKEVIGKVKNKLYGMKKKFKR